MPFHQLRRIVGLLLVGDGHEDEIFHAHVLHFMDLRPPQIGRRAVKILRIGVFVTHVLIREVDECSCNRKGSRRQDGLVFQQHLLA